jgi:hypothetical protein
MEEEFESTHKCSIDAQVSYVRKCGETHGIAHHDGKYAAAERGQDDNAISRRTELCHNDLPACRFQWQAVLPASVKVLPGS